MDKVSDHHDLVGLYIGPEIPLGGLSAQTRSCKRRYVKSPHCVLHQGDPLAVGIRRVAAHGQLGGRNIRDYPVHQIKQRGVVPIGQMGRRHGPYQLHEAVVGNFVLVKDREPVISARHLLRGGEAPGAGLLGHKGWGDVHIS